MSDVMGDGTGNGNMKMSANECQMVYMLPIHYANTLTAWKFNRGQELKLPDWVKAAAKELEYVRNICQAAIDKQNREDMITCRYRSSIPEIVVPEAKMRLISELGQWTLEKWHDLNNTECPPKSSWYRPDAEAEGKVQ